MSEEIIDKARALGTEHGKNAASWVFDGNTTKATYRKYLAGIENGDPEIMDALPTHGLSGEHAEGFSARDLERELEVHPDDESEDFGDVCDAYEMAFNEAVSVEVTRAAQYHI